MGRVFIGMSGGVDSSVAAALLKERGYDTVGVTLRLKPGDGADGDIEDAKNVAKALKIKHCVLDLRGEFKEKVMDYFAAEYLRGATPNPCVVCNREIKFGAMLKFALENGGDYVATGHYASLDKSGEHTKLLRSNSAKDQSYFLCMLSEFQLAHAMFPIDGMEKSAIRALAEKFSLPVAQKKDSQEVCFIPDNDYSSFIRSHGFKDMGEGDFLDTQGNVIGRHKGIMNYTVGQRKGLGLSGGPWFVIKKDIQENIIYVSRGYGVKTQYGNELRINDFHFITDNPWQSAGKEIDITFKIRHTPEFTKGKLVQEGERQFRILSSENLQGIAPGQFGVVYDEAAQVCVGSGEIG